MRLQYLYKLYWLGPTDRRSAPEVTFDDQRITVAVRSFDTPPDPDPLIESLQTAFGAERIVSIEWDRVDQATTTTTAPPTTTTLAPPPATAAPSTSASVPSSGTAAAAASATASPSTGTSIAWRTVP